MQHVVDKTKRSRSSIYEMLDPKSPRYDPRFPRPCRSGQRSVAWLESEIDEWIARLRDDR